MRLAFISNFQVDFAWLLSACPELSGAGRVVLAHGLQPGLMKAAVGEVTEHWERKVS